MVDEVRYDEFRGRVEALFEEFSDLVAADLEMPMLADWVLVCTHDDVASEKAAGHFKAHRKGQWTHRTAGLLIATADDFRFSFSMGNDD